MNIKKAPVCKGSLFFTSREIIKEDRERKTSSILLSVGNIFYYISETALNISLAKVVLLLTKQPKCDKMMAVLREGKQNLQQRNAHRSQVAFNHRKEGDLNGT